MSNINVSSDRIIMTRSKTKTTNFKEALKGTPKNILSDLNVDSESPHQQETPTTPDILRPASVDMMALFRFSFKTWIEIRLIQYN